MLNLSQPELQKLVLKLGSKKALGTYLGLDDKQLNTLWAGSALMTPLTYLRSLPRTDLLELLAKHGSLEKMAANVGCSASALRPLFMGPPVKELNWTEDQLIELFERFRSVALVAHMMDTTESLVRREAERFGLELALLIDYSFGGNSNAKGRRAELDYAQLRGEAIQGDRNLIDGSQAAYDFDDAVLGRVNVKSSRQYRYTAQTRREQPNFWKFSTTGWWSADTIVMMCYDLTMKTLVGVHWKPASAVGHTKTLTLIEKDLVSADALSISPVPVGP